MHRRLLVFPLLLVFVFTLLQGIAPLLHAHVGGPDADEPRVPHLHLAFVDEHVGASSVGVALQSKPCHAVVEAAQELMRKSVLHLAGDEPGPTRAALPPATCAIASNLPHDFYSPRASVPPAHLLPYSLAPPARA